MTHRELHTRNSASGQVGDHSAVVQLHHVSGDVLFLTNSKRSAPATPPRLNVNMAEQVVLATTALAALALLGWRYFSGAGRRGAGR